jgi:endonuclease-8
MGVPWRTASTGRRPREPQNRPGWLLGGCCFHTSTRGCTNSVSIGVGNVYRAELLFRHQLDPLLPGCALSAEQWSAMWSDLVELMGDGVRRGRIDTVRPEHDPILAGRAPRKDRHGGEVYVYRRAGGPCLVCGTTVVTARHAGRNLYGCPCCQRRPAP